MYWVPLLLAAWVLVDLLVVGAVLVYTRNRRSALGHPPRDASGRLRAGRPGRLLH